MLALVDAEVLETPLYAIGERCRIPARVAEDEHADGTRLSVAHGREHERLGGRRLAAHDLCDRAHVRARLRTEKGERDVEAVDAPALLKMLLAPVPKRAAHFHGNLERDEEPDPVTALDRSARGHGDV